MIADEIHKKLQNIVRGELQEGQMDSCTAIRNLLCKSFGTGPTVKSEFASRTILKEKQVSFLKSYAEKESLWLESLPSGSQYLTEGGESKVYLRKIRRQDYYNKELALALEDMHDENVIAKENVLFFIDTVFYIMET